MRTHAIIKLDPQEQLTDNGGSLPKVDTTEVVNTEVQIDPAPAAETVVEVPAEKEIDFNDFLNLTPETPKAPEVAVKPEDKPAAEVPVVKPSGRDYSGIDDTDLKLFRDMSAASFEKLKPIYLQHKEFAVKEREYQTKLADLQQGKSQLPESYLEHPEAYVLSEDYSRANSEAQDAQLEASHWETQLAKIRNGEDWQELFIDKNYNYVLGKPKPADGFSEASVMKKFLQSQNFLTEANSNVRKVQEGFKQRHQQLRSELTKVENHYFPNMVDVAKIPERDKQLLDTVTNTWNTNGFKHNPLVPILAKAYVTLINMKAELDGVTKEKAVKLSVQQDRTKAGPSGASQQTATTTKPAITMDEFEAYKRS